MLSKAESKAIALEKSEQLERGAAKGLGPVAQLVEIKCNSAIMILKTEIKTAKKEVMYIYKNASRPSVPPRLLILYQKGTRRRNSHR